MIIDPIGDLLSRIRNGQMRRKAKISSPNSRLRTRLLDVLQAEGFIRGYAEVELKGHKELEIDYDKTESVWGMDIVFNTTAKTDEEARALLEGFQFPFTN